MAPRQHVFNGDRPTPVPAGTTPGEGGGQSGAANKCYIRCNLSGGTSGLDSINGVCQELPIPLRKGLHESISDAGEERLRYLPLARFCEVHQVEKLIRVPVQVRTG